MGGLDACEGIDVKATHLRCIGVVAKDLDIPTCLMLFDSYLSFN